MKRLKIIRNEKGSLSIEFLGILPFYFLFFLLLWQVVASGYAVLHLKTAANDGAQMYAITDSYMEAKDTVMESIGGSNLLKDANVNVTPTGNNLFELQIEANHPLVFIPEKWKSTMSVPIKTTVSGKVMLP